MSRPPLTVTGASVGGTAAALLALGLWGHYPAVTVLGLCGVALVLLTGLGTARRPRLELIRSSGRQSVCQGEPVHVLLRAWNRARWVPVRATAVEPVRGAGQQQAVPVAMPLLAPGRETMVRYEVPTARRGLLTLGPLELTQCDDFGLWRRTIRLGDRSEVLVWPTVHPLPVDVTGKAQSMDGVARDGAGGSTAFHSLRDYVPGDDRRLVHWRSTARRGELTVRQLVDVVLPRLNVVLDTRAGAYPDPAHLDQAIEVVASVVAACASAAVSLRVALTSGVVHDVTGVEDTAAVLDTLATITADAGLGLLELGDRLEVAPGSRLLVLTGAEGVSEADVVVLQPIARRHEGCLVLVQGQARHLPDVAAARVQAATDVPAALSLWAHWSRR